MPALALVVFCASFVTLLFNPDPSTSIRTGAASLIGMSNFYLYKNTLDYFGETAELNTFTNTWSLGVEMQFYVLYPFVAWTTGFAQASDPNTKRRLGLGLLVITLLSFLFFGLDASYGTSGQYFLTQNRIWEIGVGCLAYLGQKSTPRNYGLLSIATYDFSLLAIIAVGIIGFNDIKIPTMMAVTAGALMLYLGSERSGCLSKLLKQELCSWLGKRSYSLYLWHWPVLALFRVAFGNTTFNYLVQIGILVTLSELTYRYIEEKFRHSTGALSAFSPRILFFMPVALSGIILSAQRLDLYLGRRTSMVTDLRLIEKKYSPSLKCINEAKRVVSTKCISKSSHEKSYFLVGDSYSTHLLPGFYRRLKKNQTLSYRLVSWGTWFPFPMSEGVSVTHPAMDNISMQMRDLYRDINSFAETAPDGSVVIISGFLAAYFSENLEPVGAFDYMRNGKRIDRVGALKAWETEMMRLAQMLENKGNHKLLLLAPLPWFESSPTGSQCESQWFQPAKCQEGVSEDRLRDRYKNIYYALDRLKRHSTNVFYVDPMKAFCRNRYCYSTAQDGSVLYLDESHLSADGSTRLFEVILSPELTRVEGGYPLAQ